MDLESDYRFLEECTRFVATRQRDPIKFSANTNGLPHQLVKLRQEAGNRKTTLRFLFGNFSKRKQNTSRYEIKARKIMWCVHWVIVNSQGAIVEDTGVDENTDLLEIFEKHLKNEDSTTSAVLEFYKSRSVNQLLFLLKAEGIPNCSNRFYEIDITKPLKETLQNKILVEFPVIHVTFCECRSQFDIIPEDEEIELLATASLPDKKRKHGGDVPKTNEQLKEEVQTSTDNFLFTNENFWQSSDEEEGDMDKTDPIKSKLIKLDDQVPQIDE